MSEKLPLELLREKYIPVEEFPEKYGISVAKIDRYIRARLIRYAEFKAPGATRRTKHVNYEEVLDLVKKEEESV